MAVGMWHVMEARAISVGIWGVPHGPARLVDVDSTVFLAFLEGLVRESDDNAQILDRLYEEARPQPKKTRAETRAARIAEITRFARMTSGEVH